MWTGQVWPRSEPVWQQENWSLSRRQKCWIPWEVSMMEIQKTVYTITIIIYIHTPFLKSMHLQLKPNQIWYSLHIFSSWSLPVHLPFSSVLLVRADSQHLPSFHACAPTDRPSGVTVFVVKCYKSGPFRGELARTEQWWPSDNKELLILMDRSSSGWGGIGGGGGVRFINESIADKPTTNQEHRPDPEDL